MTTPSVPLQGTTALVTGATSGIGRSVATSLASLGATVAVVGRREDRLLELRDELGDGCLPIATDLTDRDAARAAVSSTVERFGRLDVLVNAAGLMLNGPSLEAEVDDWDAMVDVNVKGLMYVTKAALPHLVRAAADEPRRVADIVNVSSIAGRFANRNVAVYNATKFGVTAMSESWRQEFAPHRVRVSVVEPGAVDTELFGHQRPNVQEHYERLFADVEKLQASDVADVIAFMVTAPPRMALAEVLVRPTDQA